MTDLIIGVVFLTGLFLVTYFVVRHSNNVRKQMIEEMEESEEYGEEEGRDTEK
jgi:hypothetical protein